MTKVKTSFSTKNWTKPTPKKWRDIGDALLAISIAITGTVAPLPIPDNIKVYIIAGANLIGGIGKFLTKLFG